VNHILGYGELLLEETDRPGQEEVAPYLEEIRAAGRQMLEAVTSHLSQGRISPEAFDPSALRAALTDPLGRILGQGGTLRKRAMTLGRGDILPDLARIEAAARRARELVSEPAFAPSSAGADEVSPAAPEPEPQPGPGPGRVLVVDDDEANRDVLNRRLGRMGYAVSQAANGREALEVLEAEPVDVVLLDLAMPEMDGFEWLERRNADARLRDIPTIVISASEDVDSIARSIEMGAEDYLPKPFDPILLEARVEVCLDKKRLRDQERELLATVQRQAAELTEWNETLEARVAEQVEQLDRLARLQRFLSPQLADLLVAKGDTDVLSTHRRDISVLFCDLSGFTAFAEVSEPEDVMAVLREFHQTVGNLVSEFEATVGFFAGDGLMVFFNDPLPCPDPAERAVRMAVAMRDRVTELARGWRRRGYDLGFSIGVALGYATLGEIGFEGRFDYGVIGSVVNLASRLCDQAERDQILISGRAALAAEELVELEELGPVTLKGFHAPVPAFNVVRLR
jgi:class 3 adenylate cyclase